MDHLWSPWRYKYIRANAEGGADDGAASREPGGCVLCSAPRAPDPDRALVLGRGRSVYALLNLYPYTSGHLMVVPLRHAASLTDLDDDEASSMMRWARLAETALGAVYRPDGFNVGMNLGRAAGAGIAAHLHMHVVPRWDGDANFMSVVGETRVLPEELGETRRKLAEYFAGAE